jgi:hypothetical protein
VCVFAMVVARWPSAQAHAGHANHTRHSSDIGCLNSCQVSWGNRGRVHWVIILHVCTQAKCAVLHVKRTPVECVGRAPAWRSNVRSTLNLSEVQKT